MPDFNLLITLDALLAEGSVAGAARRLLLSPSAMSRALARLRQVTGDPLLGRAGRGLVPTPRAIQLRAGIGELVHEVQAALQPVEALNPGQLEHTFTLRSSDGFAENFGPELIARIRQEAPHVRLRFMQKSDKNSTLLRDAMVDLETGVVDLNASPELRTQGLFRDRFIGVVRTGHPLSLGKISPANYAEQSGHILVSRKGHDRNQIDEALKASGLKREVAAIVDGYAAALAIARASDLVATVPERHTGKLRGGMHSFTLPISLPEITVSMLWHPRMEADPAHRWLRMLVREVCAA